jgi:hypothetical protein
MPKRRSYEPTRGDQRPAWFAEVHGSRARYRKDCRCEACTDAERRYRADYRARRRIAE